MVLNKFSEPVLGVSSTKITLMQMVDLKGQYLKIKDEIDAAMSEVVDSCYFVGGPMIKEFEKNLATYLDVKHVIACANGTDALQIALMALGLEAGDEVIVPSFTYVATAEVIGLLNLKPVMVDSNLDDFNVTAELIKDHITAKTKAIVPVHLFGQSCDMAGIMKLAEDHELFVIEDNAQAIGASYTFPDGRVESAGAIGHIGTTSFFPAKNLGCFGDGGAIFTNDDDLNQKIRMIANHGQSKRYYHEVIGCNSRLDSLQAAVLNVKLKYLDQYAEARAEAANYYSEHLKDVKQILTPSINAYSTHVFHQYTLRILDGRRDELQQHLRKHDIPTGIYYPVPLYKQNAFSRYVQDDFSLPVAEQLCTEVISLPMHTELNPEIQNTIIAAIKDFFQ